MDTEYHYWITGMLAYRAGFSEVDALTIAYASEYVDENDVNYTIVQRRDKSKYRNYMSQTMKISKPKDSLMRIYPIFHFIPGDPAAVTARRRDGKMHLLNTTPNNENANAIIDAAFKAHEDTRLYRIGIASHSFVDTWAHQNFIGWYDDFNETDLKPLPAIGHAFAGHHPDWVNHLWVDNWWTARSATATASSKPAKCCMRNIANTKRASARPTCRTNGQNWKMIS